MNEQEVNNPLVIRCKNCGGDQSFDIIKQQYVCAHCGSVTELNSQTAEFKSWKQLLQQKQQQSLSEAKMFKCPSCGAQTLASADDASAICPFCQSTMVDAKFANTPIPEVIIPFKVTKEDAEKRLQEWLSANKNNPAAQTIEKNMQRFSSCYLPYHIVRGAFSGIMDIANQAGESQEYPFKAYLSHTAVNASKEWDNLFLDGIEPFDFNDARDFDYRYLIKQKAKIQNAETMELAQRIKEETTNELYETLTGKVHSKEFSVSLFEQDNETIPAALPVYLVQCGDGIAAAVNGQNGKVSVSTGKTINKTKNWWVLPTVATIVVGLALGLLGSLGLGLIVGFVFGILFFVIAHKRHENVFVKEVITSTKKEKSHNDTQAVFFADFGKGEVPARIEFITPWRIIKTVLAFIVVTFLPVFIAIPIQLSRGLSILDIHYGYGAAWYCIPGFFAIAFAGGMAKGMMYNAPMYYEILPNGTTKRRKVNSKQPSVLGYFFSQMNIMESKRSGCLVIGFLLFLLIGSVAAMLS
ncbi:MAG: hypothetical protein IKM74_04310 [Bacteroidales bacterium]|nr:hypothetical protein [Bacteroidales bacterium]